MNLRTPAGQKAMQEALDAAHKWFDEATPEEQDAFLEEIEGKYWDCPEGIEKPEVIKKAESQETRKHNGN